MKSMEKCREECRGMIDKIAAEKLTGKYYMLSGDDYTLYIESSVHTYSQNGPKSLWKGFVAYHHEGVANWNEAVQILDQYDPAGAKP